MCFEGALTVQDESAGDLRRWRVTLGENILREQSKGDVPKALGIGPVQRVRCNPAAEIRGLAGNHLGFPAILKIAPANPVQHRGRRQQHGGGRPLGRRLAPLGRCLQASGVFLKICRDRPGI